MNRATFGPGGNGDLFYELGYKSTLQAFGWLKAYGLDAYEYEAGNGITAGDATLRAIGEKAREHGIRMSLHAPYFISLASAEEEKRLKSVEYVRRSLHAASLLGAATVVIHCGGVAKMTREEGMKNSVETLSLIAEMAGDTPIRLGLETMGKVNQLGTLDEVIELCGVAPVFSPVVDFGHLNARVCGGAFETVDDYRRVFDRIGERLGDSFARDLHCHFSKIAYTSAGEKRHLTFAQNEFGPAFEPLAQAMVKENVAPCIICESDGTQAEDALYMKHCYLAVQNENNENGNG